MQGFDMDWGGIGEAKVTLPVSGNDHNMIGTFTFRIQVDATSGE